MTEDLKKPKPDDVPGQMLLEVRCGRGFGKTYTLQLEEENAKLREEITALRKLQTDEAIKNRRLEKEIRDLKATLSESAANGGTWPV